MKLNITILTLVLGLCLSSQSFGFELLDRMLGGSGCCSSGCCEAPACGCEAAYGCEDGSRDGCGGDGCFVPACGCYSG